MCSLQNCNRRPPNPVSLVEEEDDHECGHERQNDTIKIVEITFIYTFSIFQIRVFDEQHRIFLILLGRAKYDRYKNHI